MQAQHSGCNSRGYGSSDDRLKRLCQHRRLRLRQEPSCCLVMAPCPLEEALSECPQDLDFCETHPMAIAGGVCNPLYRVLQQSNPSLPTWHLLHLRAACHILRNAEYRSTLRQWLHRTRARASGGRIATLFGLASRMEVRDNLPGREAVGRPPVCLGYLVLQGDLGQSPRWSQRCQALGRISGQQLLELVG